LIQRGFKINAVVCDGRPGLAIQLATIPVQLCQFHQVALVTRYLTRKPKSDAGKELRKISLQLKHSTKQDFQNQLNLWLVKHKDFYNEKQFSPERDKFIYTHKRLRSAYKSLTKNIDALFTFEIYRDSCIPKTTNALEGIFSDLKNKLRNHNGLTPARKQKFIDEFLGHWYRK
jgi:hypothetical protein